MGTNFYVVTKRCELCGKVEEKKHIGKSSFGWCFALHIYPKDGINTLKDWKRFWRGKQIIDEYDEIITEERLLKRITRRHMINRGRHQIGYSCEAHGKGTYDLVSSDFS